MSKRWGHQPRWWPAARRRGRRWPRGVRAWALDDSSLTRRLQQCCPGPFSVRLRASRWGRPSHDEARLLGMRRAGRALIREVHLYTGETPRVFARTVLPPATLRRLGRLGRLGRRPLGAALFADRRIRRGALACALLDARHALYAAAVEGLEAPPQRIWGRRSCFVRHGFPLLVTEIFLPAILQCRAPGGPGGGGR